MNKGFTLVELLIALMIFSVVSIGALSSLNHMMRAREHQQLHHQSTLKLDQAYAHLFQDLLWFSGEIESQSEAFSFIRTTNAHQEGQLRVQYVLREGELWRETGEQSVLILSQVKGLELSWLLDNKHWVSVFDAGEAASEPLLLRVKFQAPDFGEVTWIYSTPHL